MIFMINDAIEVKELEPHIILQRLICSLYYFRDTLCTAVKSATPIYDMTHIEGSAQNCSISIFGQNEII